MREKHPQSWNIKLRDLPSKSCPRQRRESAFTLVELVVLVAIISILAAIAIPQFAAYRRRGESGERVFAAARITNLWDGLLRSLREERFPIEIENKDEGYIETGWIEYLGDIPRGVLKVRWQERKKVIVELNKKLSPRNVYVRVSVVLEEKPPNGSWTKVNDERIQRFRSEILRVMDRKVFTAIS